MHNGNGVHDHTARNSMMAFCIGAAVGTTAALLCAPSSGKELRGQIADKAKNAKGKANDIADAAMHRVEDFKEMATDWKDRALHKADDAKDKAIATAKDVAHDASKMMQNAENKLNSVRPTAQV